jgi:hypothetical protein
MALETGQDYYNYYSGMMPWGNQGTGTTNQGTGITQLSTPSMFYPQQGGGGGGFQLPQNYYAAPNLGTPVRSMTSEGPREYTTGIPGDTIGIPQTNPAQKFWQNAQFPGKQAAGGVFNFFKKGLGPAISVLGNIFPKMSPEAAANQRWAVDEAGYGTGSQRDQFGMLVGQSLMDPSRTYEDRLGEREDELADIIQSQIARGTYKKTGWHQRQLDHINKVNQIKEQERIADQQKQESLQAQVTAHANREARERVGRGEAKDYGHTQTRSSSGWQNDPFKEGGMVRRSRGGILGAF